MFLGSGRRRAVPGPVGTAALAVLLAALLAACAEKRPAPSPSGEATPVTSADAVLAAKVPDAVKADGKISVATDPAYAPAEVLDTDGKTVVGFDVDLFNAVAAKLGLKVEYAPTVFDEIIPGVLSGEYEAGVSSFTINADRKQKALMVSYFQAGTQWLTQAGNPAAVDPEAACGRKIAVAGGTRQHDDVTARSKKCTDAKKPAISIQAYQDQTDAIAAVASGEHDAALAESPVGADAVRRSNGKLELLGAVYDAVPYGIVLGKDQQAFAEAVRDAVKAIIADGSYHTALEKWGVQSGAVADSAVAVNP